MAASDPQPTDPSPPVDPDEILTRMRVPRMNRVFVIGHGARQVTVYSQQVRALKLIWALDNADKEKTLEGERIVIVGGGVAGITAASAALILGANVTLLERNEEFLHLQRGCHTRYLHPAIYEWPHGNARRAGAGLPIADWSVGPASEVAVRILSDYYRIVGRLTERYGSDRAREHFAVEKTNARRVSIDLTGDVVSWVRKGKPGRVVEPRAIVLAVGFGVEKTVDDLPRRSYWRVDSLTQTGLDSEDDAYVVLVSGVGDGALLDLLRAKLKEFDHGGFLDECVLRLDAAPIRAEVAQIEAQARDAYARLLAQGRSKDEAASEISELLDGLYSALTGLGDLDQLLENVRPRTRIIWVGTTSRPCSLSSQPLNRVLSWRLWKRWPNDIEYRQGRVTAVRHLAQEKETGFRYVVQLAMPGNEQDQPINAHQVVLRHGPADELSRSFCHVAAALPSPSATWTAAAERLPDEVRRTFACRYRDLEIRQARTAWHRSVKLRARPEGAPVRRNERNVYRIRIWLESETGLRHVTWADYDLHPEYGGVQRRAMWISNAQGDQHFRHWVNTWDDFWVRVRCSDGSELGEWLSTAIEETPDGRYGVQQGCVDDLRREARELRHNDYQTRPWCDYVDLPWLSPRADARAKGNGPDDV